VLNLGMPLTSLCRAAMLDCPLHGTGIHHIEQGEQPMKMKQAVLAVSFAILSSTAWAGAPVNGLGQAWPNATDQSLATGFHAYSFSGAGGIHYIQINDANGNVLAAVGAVAGQYIVLPMGRFSQLVSTPQQQATSAAAPTASPTQVYNDGVTSVTATPMSDGTLMMSTSAVCDPIECNSRGAQAQ
jgi:hypothetical protein